MGLKVLRLGWKVLRNNTGARRGSFDLADNGSHSWMDDAYRCFVVVAKCTFGGEKLRMFHRDYNDPN